MGLLVKNVNYIKSLAILCLLFSLVSCHTIHPTRPTSIQDSNEILDKSIRDNKKLSAPSAKLSAGVNNALLPPLSHYVNPAKEGPVRFDVTANKVPAKEFFMGLVSETNYNMVVSPDINGTISLVLKNVTIRQTMDAVRDIYGYEYRQTSYGFEVAPPHLETRIYHVNYLDVQRTGRSYTQLTTGQVSNQVGTVSVGGTTINTGNQSTPGSPGGSAPNGLGTISSIETRSEMRFWSDLEKSISGMVSTEGGRHSSINSQSGLISVHAYPVELNRVARYLNSLQSSLNRQVILEAKVLEVQLNDNYQAGVDWSVLGNPAKLDSSGNPLDPSRAGIGQDSTKAVADTDLKTFRDGVFAIRINGNFTALIELLQTQGNVQVLSSPHISTVNNQKAVIKVGQDEFFVTGVSTTNTLVGTNTLPSQNVSLTPFFSGITLDVTPEISENNTVVLHIHPSVSLVKEQIKVIGLGSSAPNTPNNLTLPLAFSTIRESDNIVRAKNGQVVVIGGLMQNNMIETIAETPWLSKIPFFGAAFRRTKQQSAKSELVILLKPIVATNHNITDEIKESKKNFEILRRPFHAGSVPKIFGNEAERSYEP